MLYGKARGVSVRQQIVEDEGSKSALIHCKQCVRRDCIPVPCLMGFRAPRNPRQGECHPLNPAQRFYLWTPTGVVAPCTRNKGSAIPLTHAQGLHLSTPIAGTPLTPPFWIGECSPTPKAYPLLWRGQLSADAADTIAIHGGVR